jgi:type I restriction enzyme M protein
VGLGERRLACGDVHRKANVNILTSLLFLKKKPANVVRREAMNGTQDYAVFMAVAEKVGFDRRGNKVYKRSPEGEELSKDVEEIEIITVASRKVVRTLRRKTKIIDDDLPVIADRYRAFRREQPEPGT